MLRGRKFMTLDDRGCQFEVFASYYDYKYILDENRKMERIPQRLYQAWDFRTETLKELKTLVANME